MRRWRGRRIRVEESGLETGADREESFALLDYDLQANGTEPQRGWQDEAEVR
jgi:hypothetical protein